MILFVRIVITSCFERERDQNTTTDENSLETSRLPDFEFFEAGVSSEFDFSFLLFIARSLARSLAENGHVCTTKLCTRTFYTVYVDEGILFLFLLFFCFFFIFFFFNTTIFIIIFSSYNILSGRH